MTTFLFLVSKFKSLRAKLYERIPFIFIAECFGGSCSITPKKFLSIAIISFLFGIDLVESSVSPSRSSVVLDSPKVILNSYSFLLFARKEKLYSEVGLSPEHIGIIL